MKTPNDVEVAVLLATYNGARFIEPQVASLRHNSVRFTLHWLDDHSTDDTREKLRSAARESGVALREWHHAQRLGPWIGFYQLIESVEADIYLFCDQDDIWQPGKIDATVAHLLPQLITPSLCVSDPLTFRNENPAVTFSTFEMLGQSPSDAMQESRIFMSPCAFGHTMGFTRPLREMFLRHKDIARSHSMGHDWWIYLLAVATGTASLLTNVPTTLYRRHGGNFSDVFLAPKGNRIVWLWRLQQMLRQSVARQAEGFVRAAGTLPPGPKLDRVVALARQVATLDRRQSPAALYSLARSGALWPSWRWALPFSAACLCADARAATSPQVAFES